MASAVFFRSLDESAFKVGLFKNRWLIGALLALMPITAALVYYNPVSSIFSHQPLELKHWTYIAVAGLIPIISLEILKQIANRYIDKSYMYKNT
jgi:Ca2+-transporting ATPase